jgi:hypothetical protein
MWAQLVKMRLRPGKDMTQMNEQIKAAEQPGSRLVRTLIMHDQKDPARSTSWSCSTARSRRAHASRTRNARKG